MEQGKATCSAAPPSSRNTMNRIRSVHCHVEQSSAAPILRNRHEAHPLSFPHPSLQVHLYVTYPPISPTRSSPSRELFERPTGVYLGMFGSRLDYQIVMYIRAACGFLLYRTLGFVCIITTGCLVPNGCVNTRGACL